MEDTVIIQVYFATRVVLKNRAISLGYSPVLDEKIFSHETRFNGPIAGERKYLIYSIQLFIAE